MFKSSFIFLILFISVCSFASVDLHMHLTMEIPLKNIYTGHLLDNSAAVDASSRFKSRVDFASLESSGVTVVVAALFINNLWGNYEKQIDDQMTLLNDFCKLHKNWTIVSEPIQAQEELRKGNKIFILSLEGGWIFEDPKLFKKIIETYNIRIVTPVHFTDFTKKIGTPAKQSAPVGWLQQIFDLFDGSKKNAVSPLGKELFNYLLVNKIWVDLSHSSKDVVDYFLQIRPAGYPLLLTHTVLEKYYGTDRGISEKLIQIIAKEGGLVGLLPSSEMLINTPIDTNNCKKNNVFSTQWYELYSSLGEKLVLGSDLNSVIPSLVKNDDVLNCQSQRINYGWITAADLKPHYALQSENSANIFISTWKKVR